MAKNKDNLTYEEQKQRARQTHKNIINMSRFRNSLLGDVLITLWKHTDKEKVKENDYIKTS